MKPFTTIAASVFALVAFMHVLRLFLGWEVTVNGAAIPMSVSALGLVIAVSLAFMLWRENRTASKR